MVEYTFVPLNKYDFFTYFHVKNLSFKLQKQTYIHVN